MYSINMNKGVQKDEKRIRYGDTSVVGFVGSASYIGVSG
jgi:hypothetical protein